ncbi:MAG: NAD(P)H-binding protein [Rhodobacteraceae bacterium]|nr:NAD(P)H-binding protein [Paracoccaceae bacterium]MCP5342893.1 NAD(P)H-binding protein [Paracoccaceae bacterium]
MTEDFRTGIAGRRVFVTGATGFIGRRLVTQLTEAGADVTVLARSKAGARNLAQPNPTVVVGSMSDAALLGDFLTGCDVLFNIAYDVRASAAENLRAFERLREAAQAAGVGRIVHTSSIVVYDAWPKDDISEAGSMARPGGSPYRQAKIEMERRLMAGPLPAAILQPTIVYGPGSTLWTDGLARALTRGDVVLPTPEGLCNGVFVDDVVQAALRAALIPDLGQERFVISGERTFLWSEMIGGYARILGPGKVRHEPVGDLAARLGPKPDDSGLGDRPSAAARISALARRLLGHQRFEALVRGLKSRLSRGGDFYPDHHLLEEFCGTGRCHIDHARDRLGYAPAFDLARGLERTADHLRTLAARGS